MTAPRASTPTAIRCEGLSKTLGGQRILDGIDLRVAAGEVVSILGPSGSGKSTLLRCLNWLAPPSAGRVWLGEEEVGVERDARGRCRPLREGAVRRQRMRIGMVFQQFNLWPHMTALENVMEALVAVKRLPADQARERARAALDVVGLGTRLQSYPAQLSGGQQQRVAIARAIAMQPEVILFDEPTSALDPELVGEVLSVMRDLARDATTMLVVTHEIAFAESVCDRVVFMDQGRIVEDGPPAQVIHAPRQDRTRRFLERYVQ